MWTSGHEREFARLVGGFGGRAICQSLTIQYRGAEKNQTLKMKPVEIRFPSSQVQCPHCKAAMQLVRHIDLKGMPDIYIFYCNSCQHVETVKEERAA